MVRSSSSSSQTKINQFRFKNFQFSGCYINPHFFPRMVCFSSPLPPPKKTENAQNFLKSALKESWHLFDQPPCSKVTYIAARPGIYRASVFGLRHGWTVTRGKSDITRGSLEENGVSFFGKRDRKLETQPNG